MVFITLVKMCLHWNFQICWDVVKKQSVKMPFKKKQGGSRGGGRPEGPSPMKSLPKEDHNEYKRTGMAESRGQEDTSLTRAR